MSQETRAAALWEAQQALSRACDELLAAASLLSANGLPRVAQLTRRALPRLEYLRDRISEERHR